MILTVCLDESGTHADSPISVMAGYVGYGAMEARRGGLLCVLKTTENPVRVDDVMKLPKLAE